MEDKTLLGSKYLMSSLGDSEAKNFESHQKSIFKRIYLSREKKHFLHVDSVSKQCAERKREKLSKLNILGYGKATRCPNLFEHLWAKKKGEKRGERSCLNVPEIFIQVSIACCSYLIEATKTCFILLKKSQIKLYLQCNFIAQTHIKHTYQQF